ncbi:MAG: hypothetical protein MHM6MM_001808 [Cercozoa sp. M6MM]
MAHPSFKLNGAIVPAPTVIRSGDLLCGRAALIVHAPARQQEVPVVAASVLLELLQHRVCQTRERQAFVDIIARVELSPNIPLYDINRAGEPNEGSVVAEHAWSFLRLMVSIATEEGETEVARVPIKVTTRPPSAAELRPLRLAEGRICVPPFKRCCACVFREEFPPTPPEFSVEWLFLQRGVVCGPGALDFARHLHSSEERLPSIRTMAKRLRDDPRFILRMSLKVTNDSNSPVQVRVRLCHNMVCLSEDEEASQTVQVPIYGEMRTIARARAVSDFAPSLMQRRSLRRATSVVDAFSESEMHFEINTLRGTSMGLLRNALIRDSALSVQNHTNCL